MSQFWAGSTAGSLPPSVSEEFDTQNGNAVPLAHILIVNGFDSTENNANGIITKGGVAGTGVSNEVDIVLTNRYQQTSTTSDGLGQTQIITILSALSAGTYTLDISIAAFDSVTPAGNGYTIVGAVRSTGAATVLIPNQQKDSFEENVGSNAVMGVSGNTIIVTLTGIAGKIYNWNITGTYTLAS
jgi:hypothetical protein